MFFTIVNPMKDEHCMEETSCDLTKPGIVPDKKNLETSSKYCILVQFETRSRERIATIAPKIITVLTRYRPIVLELI